MYISYIYTHNYILMYRLRTRVRYEGQTVCLGECNKPADPASRYDVRSGYYAMSPRHP